MSVTASSAETTIFSYNLPGNTLPTNGELRIQVIGSEFNNTGGNTTQTFRVYIGATVVLTLAVTNGSNAGNTVAWQLDANIAAAAATNAQYANATYIQNSSGALGSSATAFANTVMAHNTNAADTTATQAIKVTVQNSSASGSATINAYSAKVVQF